MPASPNTCRMSSISCRVRSLWCQGKRCQAWSVRLPQTHRATAAAGLVAKPHPALGLRGHQVLARPMDVICNWSPSSAALWGRGFSADGGSCRCLAFMGLGGGYRCGDRLDEVIMGSREI